MFQDLGELEKCWFVICWCCPKGCLWLAVFTGSCWNSNQFCVDRRYIRLLKSSEHSIRVFLQFGFELIRGFAGLSVAVVDLGLFIFFVPLLYWLDCITRLGLNMRFTGSGPSPQVLYFPFILIYLLFCIKKRMWLACGSGVCILQNIIMSIVLTTSKPRDINISWTKILNLFGIKRFPRKFVSLCGNLSVIVFQQLTIY